MTGETPFLVVLPAAGGVASLGGKGASLSRLVAAGYPVPATAVLRAHAYRAAVRAPEAVALLDEVAHADDDHLPTADTVDRVFLGMALPAGIEDELRAFVAAAPPGRRHAVRSSATAEDMGAVSFAGQYRSLLDVVGAEAMLRAVRLTWASLWHPSAVAYRRAWAVGTDEVAMAVVVMEMVPTVEAGVVFTRDPAGDPATCRVESVTGLGEELVSGRATPTVHLVGRTDVGLPSPGDDLVTRAARLALAIEEDEGVAQDVEWAWDGDRVWVVQARPVTAGTVDELDTPGDDHELTSEGIAEMLPGVLPPLVWEVNQFLVEEAFRSTLAAVGALPHTGPHNGGPDPPLIRRVQGRAALDFDRLRSSASTLPHGAAADDLEARYFGRPEDRPRDPAAIPPSDAPQAGATAGQRQSGGRRLARAAHGLRTLATRRHLREEARLVLALADTIDGRTPELVDRDDEWVLAYRARLRDLGARAMAAELATAAVAIASYEQLEDMLRDALGAEQGASVARQFTDDPERFRAPPAHASRSVFGGRTWEDDGLAAPGSGPATAHPPRPVVAPGRAATEHLVTGSPEWKRGGLVGSVIDVRLHLLRRLAADATAGLTLREHVKRAVLVVGGEMRRVHRELGVRLVDRGVLDDPDDVDLLLGAELRIALLEGRCSTARLARRRRALERARASAPLPLRFRADRPPTARPRASVPVDTVATLSGWAASAGAYTGRARVVHDASGNGFRPGEVLVAVSTDAGWSPLLLQAGAVVVERGGPLSHAAIVAREAGAPAVLNVTDATLLLDGRTVTVDGDHGVVTIHRREEQVA